MIVFEDFEDWNVNGWGQQVGGGSVGAYLNVPNINCKYSNNYGMNCGYTSPINPLSRYAFINHSFVNSSNDILYVDYWFKITSDGFFNGSATNLSYGSGTGASEYFLVLRKTAGVLHLQWQNAAMAGGRNFSYTAYPLSVGVWYHIRTKWKCDNVDGVEYLWVNGTILRDFTGQTTDLGRNPCDTTGYGVSNRSNINYEAIDLCFDDIWESFDGFLFSDAETQYLILDEANIKSKSEAPYCIKPFNMPYARMTENLDLICKAAFDSDYNPWEWWIDDDGEIHFDERRGTDLSATIRFVAVNVATPCEVNLGDTSKSLDSRKSVQRIRLTGKSEGRRQDEITSNWQLDPIAMTDAGTFYEEIISEKTVTGRPTINEWARVYLAQLKALIEEIEVTIERDSYVSGSWGVGDDVHLYDPKSRITAGAYRIKKVDTYVDADGEHITLTVTNAWQDITDAIADIYRKIKQMQMTGFVVEDWTAGGTDQGKEQAKQMENLWNINKEYEQANEFGEPKEDNPNNSDSYICNGNYPDVVGQDIRVRQDELTVLGSNTINAGVQRTVAITTRMRYTDWDRNPRFHVRLILNGRDGEGEDVVDSCMQSTDDYANFGILNSQSGAPASLFLFQIQCTHVGNQTYDVNVLVNFNGSGLISRTVKEIVAGEMHDYEARVDWLSRYVFFYIDNEPVAVFPIDDACFALATDDMELMYITTIMTSSEAVQPKLEFYTWKTQHEVEGKFDSAS